MKNYIKPEVKVYEVRIESLLSESGQIDCGFAPKRDFSLFDEENGDGDGDGHTGSDGLWDDEDFED